MSTKRTGAEEGVGGVHCSSVSARRGVRRWRWERAEERIWEMLLEAGGGGGVGGVI